MLRRAIVPIIVALALNAREARALVVDLPRTGAPCVATPALACGSAQALLTGAFLLPATQADEAPGAPLAVADGALAAGDFNMLARLARPAWRYLECHILFLLEIKRKRITNTKMR